MKSITPTREFVERRVGSCGCPEEVWIICGLDVTLHFERNEDGPFADVFCDGGDWDVENRHGGEPDAAREEAFRFIESWAQ